MNKMRRINAEAVNYRGCDGMYVTSNDKSGVCPICAKPINCADMVLAASYVKSQEFEDLYSKEEALYRGTLFRGLDKPFLQSGRGCR